MIGVGAGRRHPAWLLAHVERLTERHEPDRERPWQVSLNRGEADRAGVTTGLRADADPASAAMADLIERRD